MKILITGFDPFGGETINPAYEAVKLLPDMIEGAKIIKIEIPTVFGRDEEVVRAAVEKHHPDTNITCRTGRWKIRSYGREDCCQSDGSTYPG